MPKRDRANPPLGLSRFAWIINGGEWLQGAGQFNQMEAITQEEWDFLEKIVRANQKKS